MTKAANCTRFAPSPTGYMHLGHAWSLMAVIDLAETIRAQTVLRIDNVDATRARAHFEAGIISDCRWLGFTWDALSRQSDRLAYYGAALTRLADMGVAYRCFCSRSDIQAAQQKRAVPHGPEGPHYPGTCRSLDRQLAGDRAVKDPHGWRLDVAKAKQLAGPLSWQDWDHGEQKAAPDNLGDIMLASRDRPASYHLAVVVDDAIDKVTHIVRGADLIHAVDVHRLLQTLLQLPQPVYRHHGLLLGEDGRKLSKSSGDLTLMALRESGHLADELCHDLKAGRFPAGISYTPAPYSGL